ncbi:creatininase [Shewanella sp. NFH-SH190041]|uniref:creatininase n=1 Tax=Shewanella sp. NFH-SH190041 TaxID=2950245 RepID=UPI0021C35F6C|nr:creatininase [Shewanella sp. NFH-SH190041]BDM63133.1 creatininase [Shewanella sp. NFH-SH190041]
MPNSVHIAELDSFTYKNLIQGDVEVLLIPVGAVEQHGPHMSMNVDILLPTKMAELVAKKINALVAPAISYGYKSQQRSGGGNHLIGTASLDGITLIELAKTIIKEYCSHGFKKIVFVNGHYENNYFLIEGIDLALRELKWSNIDDVRIMSLSYWDFVDQIAIDKIYPDGFPGWDIEHGGVLETSMMLYFYPELVHMDKVVDIEPAKIRPYDIYPEVKEYTPDSGCLSSAKASTAEKGSILAEVAVAGIVNAVNAELR